MPTFPKVTPEMVKRALLPPNNCQVAGFLPLIKDADTRRTVQNFIELPPDVISARDVQAQLIEWGFDADLVPARDHIQAHRAGSRPCRCTEYAIHEAQAKAS